MFLTLASPGTLNPKPQAHSFTYIASWRTVCYTDCACSYSTALFPKERNASFQDCHTSLRTLLNRAFFLHCERISPRGSYSTAISPKKETPAFQDCHNGLATLLKRAFFTAKESPANSNTLFKVRPINPSTDVWRSSRVARWGTLCRELRAPTLLLLLLPPPPDCGKSSPPQCLGWLRSTFLENKRSELNRCSSKENLRSGITTKQFSLSTARRVYYEFFRRLLVY